MQRQKYELVKMSGRKPQDKKIFQVFRHRQEDYTVYYNVFQEGGCKCGD